MFILLTFFHDCINPLPLKRDRIYDNMKKRRPLFFKDSTRSFRSSESLKKSGRGDHVLVRSFPSHLASAQARDGAKRGTDRRGRSCRDGAKWLNTSPRTVSRYIESGKVWNNLYVSAP